VLEITREASGYVCRFSYDPELIEALKSAVPRRHRRWDKERKAWLIAGASWPLAERVFQQYGLLEGVHKPRTAWDTLHLQPTAPPEAVKAVYKALARIHHPTPAALTRRCAS
jgi:hypothetical protein